MERAHAPLHSNGGFAPVDAEFALVELGRIARALARLRLGAEGTLLDRIERPDN